jgi:hypothetical protein
VYERYIHATGCINTILVERWCSQQVHKQEAIEGYYSQQDHKKEALKDTVHKIINKK